MKALRNMWVLGAAWVKETADVHFRLQGHENSYLVRNFAITTYGSIDYKSANPSLLARIRNSLVQAIEQSTMMADLVLIVLEDDVINSIKNVGDDHIGKDYQRRIKWLMSEFRKIIEATKDYLPYNAKASGKPEFLWIIPTRHVNYRNNFYRKKFGYAIEMMTKFYEQMFALRLVQKWDFNDSNLYLREEGRHTYDGKAEMWKAVDKTVEFFVTKYQKKLQQPEETTVQTENLRRNQNNRRNRDDMRRGSSVSKRLFYY